ncbi:dipeptide ABC transporter ATP-binding protein [Kaistia terrae]|uniref:Dipeptide ABC transporter ATP-binding protein n=1 Tax=Kaistia terrae TaxID=537017 RepID=A0ABW0PT68_9HYPH|nr:ABC transporter ATP-binding protein [Kaistia terrae]MCX5577166.1 ABC transporter ATP-binding protein [Kaistia terrae]
MSGQSLIVEDLSVTLGNGASRRRVVRDISFTVEPGKAVALVGESGSGKSVTARTLVGLAGAGAGVSATRLQFGETDLRGLTDRQWRGLRGKDIGFILQDALVSLDPLRPVGDELIEALSAHGWGNRETRRQRMLELLDLVGIPEPQLRARQRPDQLSGGLRQRALIATALALDPAIVIADEPTTALDTTVQAQILKVLQAVKQRGKGLLIISHDLAVVSQIADHVVVMHQGDVVEQGPTEQVLGRPRHAYTRLLLGSVPGARRHKARIASKDQTPIVLEASNLSKTYAGPDRSDRRVVDDVSFTLRSGQTLGIVGESGSGKTTAARIALGLVGPDRGEVTFDGSRWNAAGKNAVSERARRPQRPHFGVIYQDPLSSFDPRWNVGRILSDALDAGGLPRSQHAARVASLLERVRLPAEYAGRWPLQLSGGQRQRIAIARAIASNPKVIVCDEPVSALDVSVQKQVLDLLRELQDELGVSYLFISHDLGVIREISDEVLVMLDGRVVERGATEDLFINPQHEFTRRLLASAPHLPQPNAGAHATDFNTSIV